MSEASTPAAEDPSPERGRPRKLIGGVSVVFFLIGVAVLLLVPCPSSGQAYAAIMCIAVGGAGLVFLLAGTFALKTSVQGFSGGGAGAALLLFFFFTPGVLETIVCRDLRLYMRVCEQRTCPAGAIADAVVRVIDRREETLRTNHNGEAEFVYQTTQIGRDVQIWAEAEGFQRSVPFTTRLPSTAESSLPLPLAKEGEPVTAALPMVREGTDFAKPITIDAEVTAGLLRRAEPSELSQAGVAAFSGGRYDDAVALLEAARRASPAGTVLPASPYLAAAYLETNRQGEAGALSEEVRRQLEEAESGRGADPERQAQLRFLEANARNVATRDPRVRLDAILRPNLRASDAFIERGGERPDGG